MSVARHFAVGAALLALVTSCLSSLPDPLVCPAAARFPALDCKSGAGGPGLCSLDISCLQREGRACTCSQAVECTQRPSADTCTPAPECPAALRRPNATCRQAIPTFAADIPQSTTESCACGCVSCAALCDGFGPIIGVGPTGAIQLKLDPLPPAGRFGLLVRARGATDLRATFNVSPGATPNPQTTQLTGRLASNIEFQEVVLGPEIDLARERPQGLVLNSLTEAVEIDCIVPYFTP